MAYSCITFMAYSCITFMAYSCITFMAYGMAYSCITFTRPARRTPGRQAVDLVHGARTVDGRGENREQVVATAQSHDRTIAGSAKARRAAFELTCRSSEASAPAARPAPPKACCHGEGLRHPGLKLKIPP